MDAADCQPPLHWWNHLWRYALVVVISGFAWFEIAQWQAEHRPLWFWADLAIGVACGVLVWWRRSHPIAVNVVINLLAPISATAGGPATLALMSLATRRRWREIVPIGLLGFVSGLVQTAVMPLEPMWAVTIPFVAAIIGVTIGWGLYIGSRRELMSTLHDRAARAEAEQAMRVAQARTSERARIAREMHDVMAHRISLVTMHAGALAYRDDLDPAQVRETAALIQRTSHQALDELREVLGVLRDDAGDDAAPERPQPSAADVTELLDEAATAGMAVRAHVDVDLDAVPVAIGRTLYRVVQETLTNARKHAPGTTVTLDVQGGPGDGVRVRVGNPQPFGQQPHVPGSGLGLVGLAERAQLVGGRLSHRTGTNGEFVVEGWLPWPT